MRALQLIEDRRLEIVDIAPPPPPALGEVTLRIKAVALNHIDVWGWRGMAFAKRKLPLTVGAEASGEVEAVDHRREIEKQVAKIEKIETALEPHFQQLFIDAMALPNKVDPFPKLAEQVKLPPRKATSEDGVGGEATPRRRSREERAARRGRE